MIWAVVIGVVVFALLAVFVWSNLADVFQTLRAILRRPRTGREALPGKDGVARTRLEPEGMVSLEGELWKAVSENGHMEPGTPVRVKRVEGLKLYVSRKK